MSYYTISVLRNNEVYFKTELIAEKHIMDCVKNDFLHFYSSKKQYIHALYQITVVEYNTSTSKETIIFEVIL